VSETGDGEGADLTDAPHPRTVPEFFGHRDAETALLDAFRSGRMAHAWLIGGPRGIGKATLAYRMARFALAHPDPKAAEVAQAASLAVDRAHAAARQMAAQAHPDLLTLEREIGDTGKLRSVITVEQIRRTVGFFGSTAGEGGWRIVIADALDDMNAEGENALLKLLEEPPARSLLFLIAHRPGRVRATIRSRCRRLALRPLESGEVARACAHALGRSPNDSDIKAAAAAAEGGVARAIELLDSDQLKLRQRIVDMLAQLPQIDPQALHALGDAIGGTDQKAFEGVIDALNAWMAAQLHANVGAPSAVERERTLLLAESWERINRMAGTADAFNLDRKPLIFEAFGALAEAARR
jgi:DNA polymerase-3 subunit delta'